MIKFFNRQIIAVAPFLLSLLFLCFSAVPAGAQESGATLAPGEGEQSAVNVPRSGNLIRTLGLTPDQLARIRMIREQNREERRLANERLRNAHRALDEAIYADAPSEAVIEERARELAAAQAASVRLRALTELSIRRVLTPEQLGTLRTLRQRQTERRLERQLNMPRRLRDRRAGNNENQFAFPREGFGQRENAPALQTDDSRPVASPRERRREAFRRRRP